MKQKLLNLHTVTELDKSYEGIMWLNVYAKHSSFNICVCCLPPYKSLRVDAEEFLDTLLSQVYGYQKECPFIICGDCNSRIRDNTDYIEWVDDKPEMSVLDFESNPYLMFLSLPTVVC